MDQSYVQYLSLLDELRTSLDQLSDLARQKTAAVRRDDLIALDEALKLYALYCMELDVERCRADDAQAERDRRR